MIENKVSFWFRLLQQAILTEPANYFNAIYPYIHIFCIGRNSERIQNKDHFFLLPGSLVMYLQTLGVIFRSLTKLPLVRDNSLIYLL